MNTVTTPQAGIGLGRKARRITIALASVFAVAGSLLTALPAVAADPLPDGLSQASAAGSCWEIKQNTPAAADGVYWLLTPALKAPEQFYCDQTTDGGGWVMIARGRDGWKWQYNGLRSAATLRNIVTGTAAFPVAQLPGTTVDALLNKGRVDALTEGVRVRRATNESGTTWQELRWKYVSRDRWSWTFGADHRVSTWRFDNTNGSGGTTNNFGNNQGLRRVDSGQYTSQGFIGGISFGPQVIGRNNSTSYLWSFNDGAGSARPFAQMFLRPRLTIAGMNFGTIPDAGAPATELTALPESDAMRTVWGVSGFANGNSGELNTEVAAFGQSGNHVYVGGNFRYVHRTQNASGADRIEHPNIASFNVSTAEFEPGFDTQLNGQVKAIVGLPDGRVMVGGQFSTANGVAQPGLVIVDPATGATTGWQVSVENRTTGGVMQVRGLSVQGNYVYVAGSFTHLKRNGATTAASTWNGGRINVTTGVPDTNWNPLMNGTSVGVDASPTGDRTYYSGYFRMSGSAQTLSGTALQTVAGAPVVSPLWAPTFSRYTVDADGQIRGNIWQLGIREAGGKVWMGGSEHNLFAYDRNNWQLKSGSIAYFGGDMQAVTSHGNIVFAGCHCGEFLYEGSYTWPTVGTSWTQADKMNLIGAWDVATGKYLVEFSPILQARAGYGTWAIFTDSTGVLWNGGDFTNSVREGEINQWSGGFTRFAPRDVQAPSKPGAVSVTPFDSASATLSWGASTDDRGAVTYEVLRDNRVIATTTARTMTVPVGTAPARYFVRAADAAGNRSATTAVATVSPPSNDQLIFIDASKIWKWRFDSAALPATWNQRTFDDSSWASGLAVFGLGTPGAATDINAALPNPRPLSAQFRASFQVTDPLSVTNGSISVVANDGVVVYVNGVEIGRANLPAGTLTQNSFATAAPRSNTAAANPVVFTVPSSVLVAGVNVVAASTHANFRTTPDLSFDLRFTAQRGTPPPAPAAVSVTGIATGPSTIDLSWAHAPGSTVTEYRVSRDGTQVGVVPAPGTGFSDSGLAPSTAYSYSVVGVDSLGQQSPPGTATVTTQPGAPDPNVTLVAPDATWKWRFSGDALPSGWAAAGFDDSTWASGVGVFGVGIPGAGTDIGAGAPSPRPLSAQFRATFQVTDPGEFDTAQVSVLANDGVVVYVNGVEVGRANLPTGTLTQNTFATAAPRSGSAGAGPVTFDVPVSLLVAGTNVIAASTHANYRTTPDLAFSLSCTGTR